MTTGERIKKRRKELNITAEDLGAKIGIDRSTVYRYESGDIEKFPLSKLEPIAYALHTTVAYLMGWTDDPIDYENDELIASIPQDLLYNFNGDVKKAYSAWLARTTPDISDTVNNSASLYLNDKEKRLVTAYRNKPEMQSAIDKLLGLDDKIIQMDQPEKTYKIQAVARGGHITEFELDEQGLKDFEESAKKTDASDL